MLSQVIFHALFSSDLQREMEGDDPLHKFTGSFESDRNHGQTSDVTISWRGAER